MTRCPKTVVRPVRRAVWVACVLLAAWRGGQAAPPGPRGTVILVSIDGYRWDYFDSIPTPGLARLAREGARAERLVPPFPSKTFPAHYSIVTGLYPEQHGIVSNNMFDPVLNARFSLSDRNAVTDSRWWGGEPIWVAVERQGGTAAAFFWPGTEAEIAGVRPTRWKPYDGRVPNFDRVDTVLAWLASSRRPNLVTLYFDDVDGAGHSHGPFSPELVRAVRRVDSALVRLLDGLDSLGILDSVHVIVTSDHGMIRTSRDRVIFLDDYLDLERVDVVDWTPVLGIWPRGMSEEEILAALRNAHPRLQVWRRADVPARFHYSNHRRIPLIVGHADPGWSIGTRAQLARDSTRFRGATHGWDPELRDMGAFFVGRGPRIRRGVVAPPFQSIHVYALLAELLGITPAATEARVDSVRAVLRSP
ncbi:MAG TPA: ectonucleotide pyrophosphatase/phosphodiesterase [Gemmatimonadales bacterium]|nr:ectonucleotide pyrophosphatase/phosphodiesterase [Gemmatimonadales bacterium]